MSGTSKVEYLTSKPCVFCGRKLRSIFDDWRTYQPDGGGEVQFIFSYGSRWDTAVETTVFRGVVCDECAEKCMPRMERTPP